MKLFVNISQMNFLWEHNTEFQNITIKFVTKTSFDENKDIRTKRSPYQFYRYWEYHESEDNENEGLHKLEKRPQSHNYVDSVLLRSRLLLIRWERERRIT